MTLVPWCDGHDVPLEHNAVMSWWVCPVGEKHITDADVDRLTPRGSDQGIRMTGCGES